MDTLVQQWLTKPIVLTCLIAAVSLLLLQRLLTSREDESAIAYEVDIPPECREGVKLDTEVLENPSIQIPGSTAIQCYAPATGQSLGRVNPATPDGIDRAIAKAAAAQVEWAKTSFAQRRRVLRTLLKYILTHQDAIVKAACLDSGKTRVDAAFGEILTTVEKLSWTIANLEKVLRPDRRGTNLLMCYKKNEFHNALSPLIASLATGNALILKCSEATAYSTRYFASIAHAALSTCGHSPSLLQSITCWPSTASHLTSHPGISHITFIGSRAVGLQVAASAARSLTPCVMELGGKDAAVVCDDVDEAELERIVAVLMRGVFQASGQNCIGIERVIAVGGVYERLVRKLLPRIRALRVGNPLDDEAASAATTEKGTSKDEPTDVGALISAASFHRLESLIASAVSEGAQLLHGGTRYHPPSPSHTRGHYFTPTLLTSVTPTMAISQTELFAPILLLMPASSPSHAISLANSAPAYSLGSSIFSSSPSTQELLTRSIRAGMVSVNDFGAYYLCNLPFGGTGGSGYGRFGGVEGLRGLCNGKSVCRDGWGGVVRTRIPGVLDLGTEGGRVGEGRKWAFVKGVVGVGYGVGAWERVRGLWAIIRNG
ncbi:MAG: Meiotic Sister-Chromatid recombination aldehyde dehydrogenase [Chrysothrix sp. TS-e1954]|nr:MAG: Meiotic Sister-Chromatid recombination aldehyde dehydrogenase [Chrysothrix sp. TS-e1954]